MTYKLRSIWKFAIALTLGIAIGLSFSSQTTPINLENPFSGTKDVASPQNWITQDQISVYEDQIIISVKDAKWAKFTDTNSMDPVFDSESNAIQIVPKQEELGVGDIITYKKGNQSIIHRIVEIGDDGQWFVYTKGDNNSQRDSEKIRFTQIEKVVIGVLY